MNPRVLVTILVVAALLVIGAFAGFQLAGDDNGDGGDGGVTAGPPRVPDPTVSAPDRRQPEETPTTRAQALAPISSIRVKATPIAAVSAPVDLATRPGDDTLYVAEQGGRLQAVRSGGTETLLDLSGEVSTGTEQGLLGLEFSPDGSFLYANFTDTEGDTRVVEWSMRGERLDPSTRREVLALDQPFANHNGGALEFGPDGFLYVSTGDGGSGGDPHGNGQDLSTLLGKILRIHPRPTGNAPYAVPSSNPFLETEGAREEIWAYGLRNPWRISFDSQTGDLWIADVGQGAREEINFQPASSTGGDNSGWNRLEGTLPFEGSAPPEHVPPIHEYALHEGGTCAVVGGHVYRGERIPALQEVYVFADACQGRVMGLRQTAGQVVDIGAVGNVSFTGSPYAVAGFGEDAAGELYVLSLSEGLFRLDPA